MFGIVLALNQVSLASVDRRSYPQHSTTSTTTGAPLQPLSSLEAGNVFIWRVKWIYQPGGACIPKPHGFQKASLAAEAGRTLTVLTCQSLSSCRREGR